MKYIRFLLFPFSLLYGLILHLRNKCYDYGILKSYSFSIPVIVVGNLATGGTGKSPMIEFLLNHFKTKHRLGVVSRGYKRQSKGYREVFEDSTVGEVGDEPLQIKRKFPDVVVAVSEKRTTGIEKIKNRVEVVLLDDAFQHREVKASQYILLTTYYDRYSKDFVLPTGNLREFRNGAKRADIIVVTKCPPDLSRRESEHIKKELNLRNPQKCYFSTIVYASEIVNHTAKKSLTELKQQIFTLVTGIANPDSLVAHLKNLGLTFKHSDFPDHHYFSDDELEKIQQEPLIVTTEKDYMRMAPRLKNPNVYFLPISVKILFDETPDFLQAVNIEKR